MRAITPASPKDKRTRDRNHSPARLAIFNSGGGGGIRTPEALSGLTVFKTAGFNRSPTPPFLSITCYCS